MQLVYLSRQVFFWPRKKKPPPVEKRKTNR